ncbi:carboxymuconolactone decarboxylase family protein [Streptomyces hoynatensis]|uniref:Carboxymuconolactone decarboxylase family protein n=1 Tax=Streptomyces hoynatensis TaxID=1141874 RepID=A0A3A9Z4K5_9ACTN|nr:carboxymuconolactone decarboxylase family protein [Streptomyces hoynatensis]RKN42989.1 carboxymuconolactone decarboxylase family protein [Streptomyces hoynatensis]
MARISLRKPAAKGIQALLDLEAYLKNSPVPQETLDLIRLRVSQINGCGYCVTMHAREAKESGQRDERIFGVAAWRETPFFTDAERAALALAESATRLADNAEGVPQDVWDEAAAHYDEESLAALVMAIASINAWNRLNVSVRNLATD